MVNIVDNNRGSYVMFIITGATGELGSRVVAQLLTRVPADQIGVSVRDPSKAGTLAQKGVRVRQGDYTNVDSLRSAFEGAKRLLLVSSNAASSGGDPLAQHRTVMDVAKEVGVARILYTSQIACGTNSEFFPARHHAATEAMLASSGMNWTALRHGFYASSGHMMNQRGFDSGVLVAPEDGKVSWTTHDDLAAVDAAILSGVEEFDGPTPPLTGAEALDLSDLAALASDILGKPVTHKQLCNDDMMANMRGRDVPEPAIAFMMSYFRAARAGEFATINSTLARILGRKPQSMRSFMEQTLKAQRLA
jgi:NAD(P)H dehydrogenase (quinone)